MLASLLAMVMNPEPWTPPPLEQRQLRGWTPRVQAQKDIRQQEENRLEAHTIRGMEDVATHVKTHIMWLDIEIKKLEKEIDDHIDQHPNLTPAPALGYLRPRSRPKLQTIACHGHDPRLR